MSMGQIWDRVPGIANLGWNEQGRSVAEKNAVKLLMAVVSNVLPIPSWLAAVAFGVFASLIKAAA